MIISLVMMTAEVVVVVCDIGGSGGGGGDGWLTLADLAARAEEVVLVVGVVPCMRI